LFQFDAFSWSLFGVALLLILLILAMHSDFDHHSNATTPTNHKKYAITHFNLGVLLWPCRH